MIRKLLKGSNQRYQNSAGCPSKRERKYILDALVGLHLVARREAKFPSVRNRGTRAS